MPFHRGGCKADFIFDIIEKRFIGNRTLNDACQLALLKHFAEKTDITQAELEIEDTLLKYYIYNNMYFDFFARLDYRLLEKYFLYDKAFLQYESTPGTHVVLHYSRDEDGEEFNSEDMVEMYDGIYVKTFVIFFGELIRYLSLIHISEPTRQAEISYAVFCLKKKKKKKTLT